ncbi:hypothetical protein D3C78_1540050 [compost metagenome]
MQLTNFTPGKQRSALGDFLCQHRQIFIGLVRLTRHQFVAATEIAEFVAERDMHIQRQRTFWIARSSALKRRFVIALVELQRCGV